MRFLPLLAVFFAGCSSMKSISLPWNSRTHEQARLNAATEPKPQTREEEILHPNTSKEFNPRSANLGGGRSFSTKGAGTNEFQFVDRTRTKSFATSEFGTKGVSDSGASYTTKGAPTKESWFSRMTAGSKSYSTKENSEAGKKTATYSLPGGDRAFVAQGRKQGALDSKGTAAMPMGGDRIGGESWSGDLKPLTIQDIKTLLNRN